MHPDAVDMSGLAGGAFFFIMGESFGAVENCGRVASYFLFEYIFTAAYTPCLLH